MPDLKYRSSGIELMDDLNCKGEVVDQTLRELDVINKWLGGDNISIRAVQELLDNVDQPITFLDLGCGGGDILIALAKWGRKHHKQIQFIGIDANPAIVAYARSNCKDYPEISFRCINIFDQEFATLQCDILHCCLFTHHFTSEELSKLLGQFRQQASLKVIINDLHRHTLAYHSIKWLTKLFSKSPMVQHDAALSVARGFLKSELQDLLKGAQIDQYRLAWRWAFRWELIY
ncbi:MAG: methyltransferase domain-containing protein [Bacteroidota bacterium]